MCQGPALLLALAVPIGIIRRGSRRRRSNDRSSRASARSSGKKRSQQVASVDELGRDNDDDAEGGWMLEQEAWMGGDLMWPGFRSAWHGHE
jgi:hypothetical protein